MKVSLEKLAAEAEASGFRPDVLEKVARLLRLLDALRSHPFLNGKLVLKGGTALNLFMFNAPRLSVDIDLNYVGSEDRDGMIAERPKIEQALQAVLAREGFTVRRMPGEHAGGKWSLLRSNGVGQTTDAYTARKYDEGSIKTRRIRVRPVERLPGGTFRCTAFDGFGAAFSGFAAGSGGNQPVAFDC